MSFVLTVEQDVMVSLTKNDGSSVLCDPQPPASLPAGPTLTRTVFVDKGGSDATGNGTSFAPFQTIQRAMTSITDAAPTNRYAVRIGPGLYSDDFILKPNVWIVGLTPNLCRIDAANINLDATWNAPGVNNRAGFVAVQFRAPYVFDFGAIAGADLAYLIFDFVNSVQPLEVRGTDGNAWFILSSQFFAGLTQVGGFSLLQAVVVTNTSPFVATDSGPGSNTAVQLLSFMGDGPCSVVCQPGATIQLNIGPARIFNMTLDGAGIAPNVQAGSLNGAGLILLNGATSGYPIVTGAKAGNAALISLLPALAGDGLIIDQTT